MASIEIDRDIDEVFNFITDVSQMPLWVTGVSKARLVSDAMGKGAHYVLEYVGGRRSTELEVAVTDFLRPTLFSSQTERGPFAFEGRMELEKTPKGSRLTNIIEAGPDSLSTRMASFLFAPVLRRSMPRRLLGELQNLKAAITGVSPSPEP